ncbi:MAG: hypothetical protein KGI25_07905 [Thaumarchaeota archaeon]|nr:hypothetical protein [Nitrososphaerota archaeon]
MNTSTVSLFKVVVAKKGKLNLDNVKNGFITDFEPTDEQVDMLKSLFKPLPLVTLFSVEERKNDSLEYLLTKQLLHYIETYGLESPGLFDLEVTKGKIVSIAYIKACTLAELTELVTTLLEGNRPIKDVKPVIEVIRDYKIKYKLNDVANNELRIALYDGKTAFTSGDDAVRYICYQATNDPMLIKSKKVIAEVKGKGMSVEFLEKHIKPLAQVFNRHKKLIMACKNTSTATVINKISRLSKTEHVPIHEPISKHFIASAIAGDVGLNALKTISLRDKFKYLNLIEFKLLNKDYDLFNIRNGKFWTEANRPLLNAGDLSKIKDAVLASIGQDLKGLKRKKILLDSSVEYGLPISRKQSLGNLPFGTKVRATGGKNELSAGVYWRNEWGSVNQRIDLDLTAIDDHGNRTGWGGYSAYEKNAKITFSGDMTDGTNGATEFMMVNPENHNRYGLMVNVFCGPDKVGAEIVVGYPSKKEWLNNTLIRERIELTSKQTLIGFLKDDSFIIYSGRLSNSRVTVGKHPVIDKGLGKLWTIVDLLNEFGIKYDTIAKQKVVYDYDLSYHTFSFDKLEKMFEI